MSTAPPPPPSSNKANPKPFTGGLHEDPWAVADERTAVFAPPPELLASVRAAAASAGLIPSDAQPSDPEAEARVTAEFTLTESAAAESPRIQDQEVTKVAPPPAAGASDAPPADAPSEELPDEEGDAPPRRRWP